MIPKPLAKYIPRPKPERLPTRKAVTIGIGIRCQGAVVLAADRQVTVESYFKDHESKLTFNTHPNCRVVSTYAYLPSLANVLNDKVDLQLRTMVKPYGEEIIEVISKETRNLKELYPTEMQTQQFLWAVSAFEEPARLIRISNGIIDEPQWACIGVGDSSLVRYIVSQLAPIPPSDLPAADVSRLAVYIVRQAKAFVDGCGGPTDAAIIYDGTERLIEEVKSEQLEKDCESLQFALRYLYHIWTDSRMSEDERNGLLSDLGSFVKAKGRTRGSV